MASVFLVLAITACSGRPYAIKPALESSGARRSYPIFIVNHGWHTGLIVPASCLKQAIPDLKERFGGALYYEIGWGDKEFYQAQEITSGLTLQAMFWSEGAVLHIVAVPDSPDTFFGQSEIVSTCLTAEQLASLVIFVTNSFTREPSGRIVHLKQGIYGSSQFYAGEGRFHLLNTCNKWTAKGLQSAGIDVSPYLVLTSENVMSVIRELRQPCTLPPAPAVGESSGDKSASYPSP